MFLVDYFIFCFCIVVLTLLILVFLKTLVQNYDLFKTLDNFCIRVNYGNTGEANMSETRR